MLMAPSRPPPAFARLTGDPASWRERPLRLALLLAWLLTAGWLALHHAVWRDEVRALTLALSGDDVWAMLKAIHGEGHPALWYLLLRGAHALAGTRTALPATAFAIAALAAALVALRAPFRPAVIALVLFSTYALVDYTVVARNYGIAMLLMFAIADRYAAARDRGVTLGMLLFLLCNTNVPAVLLAGGVVLFWGIELYLEQGWRWTPAARSFVVNAAIAAAGVVACVLVVYPPYNDAVTGAAGQDGPWPLALLSAGLTQSTGGALLFVGILLGSLAGLIRAPAALLAAVAVTAAALLFFHLVYPGFYRHQALVLVFLLAMYWLAATGRGGVWPGYRRAWAPVVQRYGTVAFIGLLLLQTVGGLTLFGMRVQGDVFSRSQDLGVLLRRPPLRDAIVIANPDVLLEPLSYYAPNPVYLVRERRFARVVAFTRAAERDVSLGEMLAAARALHARTGRPVVVVLSERLDPAAPAHTTSQGYLGGFSTTPDQVRAFLAATRHLARFGPAQTDEGDFDAYLLTRS